MMRGAALSLAVCAVAACQQPGPLSGEAGARAPASFEIGARLIRANQPEMALGAFTRLIAEKGMSPEAMVGIGVAYLRMGRRDDAIRSFEQAIEADPNVAVARNNLGVALYEDGAYAAALSEFERAFALTGGLDPVVRTNVGIAEFAMVTKGDEVIVDDADFDVIQYGQGVYRLEPRKPDGEAAPKTARTETEAQS